MKKTIVAALLGLSFVAMPALAEDHDVIYLEKVGVWEHYTSKDPQMGDIHTFVVRINDDFNFSYNSINGLTAARLEDKRDGCNATEEGSKVMLTIDKRNYKGILSMDTIAGYPACYYEIMGNVAKKMATDLYKGKPVVMESVTIPPANLKELIDTVAK